MGRRTAEIRTPPRDQPSRCSWRSRCSHSCCACMEIWHLTPPFPLPNFGCFQGIRDTWGSRWALSGNLSKPNVRFDTGGSVEVRNRSKLKNNNKRRVTGDNAATQFTLLNLPGHSNSEAKSDILPPSEDTELLPDELFSSRIAAVGFGLPIASRRFAGTLLDMMWTFWNRAKHDFLVAQGKSRISKQNQSNFYNYLTLPYTPKPKQVTLNLRKMCSSVSNKIKNNMKTTTIECIRKVQLRIVDELCKRDSIELNAAVAHLLIFSQSVRVRVHFCTTFGRF